MINEFTDTGYFVQYYKCDSCGAVQNEEDVVSVQLTDGFQLHCHVCGSINLRCVGDNRINRDK